MAYKVIDIEGVGAAYGEKLAAAGIEKLNSFLRSAQLQPAARLLLKRPVSLRSLSSDGATMLIFSA